MADGVWKGVHSQVIGRSEQFLLNKFCDPSTPSMRKSHDEEKMERVEETPLYLCQTIFNMLDD